MSRTTSNHRYNRICLKPATKERTQRARKWRRFPALRDVKQTPTKVRMEKRWNAADQPRRHTEDFSERRFSHGGVRMSSIK